VTDYSVPLVSRLADSNVVFESEFDKTQCSSRLVCLDHAFVLSHDPIQLQAQGGV
jgi:hypothetical protein